MRRVIATALSLGIFPACAALTSWDGYTPAAIETDAGSSEKDAIASPTDSGSETTTDATTTPGITVAQTTHLSIDGTKSSVDVPFPNPAATGNTVIVAVGWYDADHDVATVADTLGNLYKPVTDTVKFHSNGDDLLQKLYVAINITTKAGSANSLQITFNGPTDSPDIRALEVAGLDHTNPFVAAVSASGRSASPTAGPVNLSVARGLVFAAGMTTESYDHCADGYTTCVLTTESGDNVAEARVVSQAGPFTITSPIDDTGSWLLQLATFQ